MKPNEGMSVATLHGAWIGKDQPEQGGGGLRVPSGSVFHVKLTSGRGLLGAIPSFSGATDLDVRMVQSKVQFTLWSPQGSVGHGSITSKRPLITGNNMQRNLQRSPAPWGLQREEQTLADGCTACLESICGYSATDTQPPGPPCLFSCRHVSEVVPYPAISEVLTFLRKFTGTGFLFLSPPTDPMVYHFVTVYY